MGILLKKAPALSPQSLGVLLTLHIFPGARAAVAKGPGVTRVVQRGQCQSVAEPLPANFSGARWTTVGELQTLPTKRLHRGPRRACSLKGAEEHSQTLLHVLVGIQDHFALF